MTIKIKCKENGLEKKLFPYTNSFPFFQKGAKFNYSDEVNPDLDGVYKIKKIKTEKIDIKGYKESSIHSGVSGIIKTADYILELEKLREPCKKSFMERLRSYF